MVLLVGGNPFRHHISEAVHLVVEKHIDGYVAYAVGLRGAVVGQGDTYDEAFGDARSAVAFHIETFGPDVLGVEVEGIG